MGICGLLAALRNTEAAPYLTPKRHITNRASSTAPRAHFPMHFGEHAGRFSPPALDEKEQLKAPSLFRRCIVAVSTRERLRRDTDK